MQHLEMRIQLAQCRVPEEFEGGMDLIHKRLELYYKVINIGEAIKKWQF